MKKNDIIRHRHLLTGGILAIILSAAAGRMIGMAGARSDSSGKDTSTPHSRTPFPDTPPGEKTSGTAGEARGTSAAKIQQRMLDLWRESPDPYYDPEVRQNIRHLLSTLTSPQIRDFLQSLGTGPVAGTGQGLRQFILQCWVFQDGPAAMTYLASGSSSTPRMDEMEVAQLGKVWATARPDEAFAWMSAGNLPPEMRKKFEQARVNSVAELMSTDPERALRELRTIPSAKPSQFQFLAMNHGLDPAIREKLLECAAGNPENLAALRSGLVEIMAEDDPASATEFMNTQTLSPTERETLELAAKLSAAGSNPGATANEWLETNDVSNGIPQAINYAIASWIDQDSEEALKWLGSQPQGEKRDTLYADSIPGLAGLRHFEKAAELTATITSPAHRATALKSLDTRWSLASPDKAGKWREHLPPEDRELLGK